MMGLISFKKKKDESLKKYQSLTRNIELQLRTISECVMGARLHIMILALLSDHSSLFLVHYQNSPYQSKRDIVLNLPFQQKYKDRCICI